MKHYSYLMRITELICVEDGVPPGTMIMNEYVDQILGVFTKEELQQLLVRVNAWVDPTPQEIALRDKLIFAFNAAFTLAIDG